MCSEEDSWDHIIMCPFYDTKSITKWDREADTTEYIVQLSREKFFKAKMTVNRITQGFLEGIIQKSSQMKQKCPEREIKQKYTGQNSQNRRLSNFV